MVALKTQFRQNKRLHSIMIALCLMAAGAALHSLILRGTTTKTAPALNSTEGGSRIESKLNALEAKVEFNTKTLRNEIKALRSELFP